MHTILDKYSEEFIKSKSPSTKKTYRHALEQFEKWLNQNDCDLYGYARTDVQSYMDFLSIRKKSPATIHKVYQAIVSFSKWSSKEAAIDAIRIVKSPSPLQVAPKALSKNDRMKLIRDVDRSGASRDFAIIILGLNTGIRLSELVNLDISDIDISERKGSLKIRSGKGNKERSIPLNAECRRALSIYLEERNDNLPALFISNRHQRISQRSVQTIAEKHEVNFHMLRHTFITELMRQGFDIAIIQSLTGHSSAEMLLRYAKPSAEEKQKTLEELYLN